MQEDGRNDKNTVENTTDRQYRLILRQITFAAINTKFILVSDLYTVIPKISIQISTIFDNELKSTINLNHMRAYKKLSHCLNVCMFAIGLHVLLFLFISSKFHNSTNFSQTKYQKIMNFLMSDLYQLPKKPATETLKLIPILKCW